MNAWQESAWQKMSAWQNNKKSKLEEFYRIIKDYKNKYISGKYYLEEERFLKIYEKVNPKKEFKIDYRGSF